VLKVLNIDNDGFSEVHNMRQQQSNNKSLNLTYSSNAIAWSHLDNSILATSATNGAVSIWDVNKFGRNKQVNVYHDHDRTTHAVTFHQTDPALLLSASQDSTLKLFDLRERSSCISTFASTESVRDVKFNPFNCSTFASVSENGSVQLWDIRKPEKFVQQFTAHSGPIYCLDYHPTQQWLATGSRDKLIKVWNMSSAKPTLEYTIHTIAVVGRIRWRPERKFHIASCSLVVDYSIYIWDVRRPFIPYASFNEHTNVTTDICFKGVPDILLSTSKDSTIYKHATKDAQHPAASANPQSGSINYKGDLLFVSKTKPKPAMPPTSGSATKLNFLKKTSIDTIDSGTPIDSFHLAKSSLHYFTMESSESAMETMRMDDALTKTLKKEYMFFRGCAIDYKLKTEPQMDFIAMLDYNAGVARKHGRANVAMLWNLVKMIYKTAPSKRNQMNYLTSQISNQSSSGVSGITRASGSFGTSGIGMMSSNGASNSNIHHGSGDHAAQSLFGGSSNDDLLDTNEQSGAITIPKVAIPDLEVEVFDENMNHNSIDSINLRNGFLYTGPHDNLIKDLPACSSSLINHDLTHAHYRNRNEMEREVETSPPPEPPCLLNSPPPEALEIQFWKPFQVLADCLMLQSEVGDAQTPATILICLGDRREDLPIDKFVQENLLQAYVDLLHRHQMWNEATEVINISWIPTVSQLNEQSTVIQTTCGECGRTLQKGWYCKHCKSTDPSKCVVCHLVVKGVFAWCSGCCHGGHLEHLQQWFLTNPRCPKCNHLCEYD
jgi:WD repeat-containing protein 24